jgi:hypothetical protein
METVTITSRLCDKVIYPNKVYTTLFHIYFLIMMPAIIWIWVAVSVNCLWCNSLNMGRIAFISMLMLHVFNCSALVLIHIKWRCIIKFYCFDFILTLQDKRNIRICALSVKWYVVAFAAKKVRKVLQKLARTIILSPNFIISFSKSCCDRWSK